MKLSTFFCVVCAVLVDQARSAHVLNWMAHQQQKPTNQATNQMANQGVNQTVNQATNQTANQVLPSPDHQQPNDNRQADTFAEVLNFLAQTPQQAPLQNAEQMPEKSPEQMPEKTPNAPVEGEQPVLVEKSEQQDAFNDTRLLSEIGLISVNKRRCRTKEDCMSFFKELHCGKLHQ